MRWWLARAPDQGRKRWIRRFDPCFWLVDFPRPMMASVTTAGDETVVVDVEFQRRADLAGLIWESADRWSHPLCALATRRDYRGLRWRFRWQSSGDVLPLDAVNGPVLTIEGRDAAGQPRTWYVRLWNYAVGSASDAEIALDFDALAGGFLLPAEADPVWAGDIDRLFISLVPPGHDGVDAPLPAVARGQARLTTLLLDGDGAVLPAGEPGLPPHDWRLCTAYDDLYNQTPERILSQALLLGWRGAITHYLGMSHFMALLPDGTGGYVVDPARPLCGPAQAWHRDFLARAHQLGFAPILSLSMELFAAHCPPDWAQRDAGGAIGLTGWVPPSALLSPCHAAAQAWLRAVVAAVMPLALAAGCAPAFQVGEPWWWVGPDDRPCLYDAATTARWQMETGSAPPPITDIKGSKSPAERAFLDWCGARLAEATAGLVAAARGVAPATKSHLLFYAPQVLLADRPDLARANMPAAWAHPAFDVLQLEDYTFVTGANQAGQQRARAAVDQALAYPLAQQHYLAGFVLNPADAPAHWPLIAQAAAATAARGVAQVFIWAWPQVARDGFTPFALDDEGDAAMPAFHDVRFPLELGFGATGGPGFSTQVVVTGSGAEQRNADWSDARLEYDAGVGIRSEADLAQLVSFFRARRGQAHGFRFLDPLDNSSAAAGAAPAATDQPLGHGTGSTTRFALVKHYADAGADDPQVRRITRPWPDSVRVAVAGVELASGWTLAPGGWIDLAVPPAAGAAVTAGYRFDVPVRFASDRIEVSIAGWRAGELPSVPLIEIRED
ncbi:MAG: TIGR02217 family protein [Alphaproteobacteria bacterium]|nr:TIGR02217 family protein [Alphaproteobacteria bacterium]